MCSLTSLRMANRYPGLLATKRLSSGNTTCEAEGGISLESAFFGADEDGSFAARTAQGAAQRKQFMALLNAERSGATNEDLTTLIASPASGHNPGDAPNRDWVTQELQAYATWKKAVNAGRVLP